MTTCFITLLNMSVTAAITAVAVMLVRAVFKKLPKWLTCALWAAVGLRLLLPFSVESAMSLIPRASTVRETVGQFAATAGTAPAPVSGGTEYFIVSNFIPPTPVSVPSAKPFDWLGLLTWGWVAGAAVMLGYMLVSALLLKRRAGACLETEPGVYLSDTVDAPFVLGVFRPKIYLPSSLSPAQKEMILAHEKAHLKRRDHLVKPLAFLLLAVYWFNPVLWVAYALLCRDIELACDERVIRDMDREKKAFYSQTLLDCGSRHRRIAACPVAFGEVGVKERVKNVLNYKKPAFWIILVAVLAGVALAVCFLTDPKTEQPKDADHATLTDSFYDETLDEKIFTTMQAQSNGKYLEGECYTEAHHIFGTEEKDGKTVVYALVRETWFGFINGYFTEVSGSQCPMVLTFDGDDCAIERALDGGGYTDSLKALFPAKYADAILQHGDRFNEKLWNDVAEQARAYLHYIDRSATVCHTSEAGLSTLSDHGVSTEVSNKLTARFDQYPFYGTEEHIENGVRYVYSTAYDAQTGQITYLKYIYGEDPAYPTQKVVIDAATGEIVSEFSAPVLLDGDIEADPDWIESTKIDETVFDVDGDGVEDRCVMRYGPTSGLFTFIFTVTSKGSTQPKYQNIFLTDHSDLSFSLVKSDPTMLYVQAVNPMDQTDFKNYVVLIEDGNIVLRGEDGDMPYWGEATGSDTSQTIYDSITLDVDGDGTDDYCTLRFGPTSGLYTIRLTIQPIGAAEPTYENIFNGPGEPSFVYVKRDNALYVKGGAESGIRKYRVVLENGRIVLRGKKNDVTYWVGEDDDLFPKRQKKLKGQVPELFNLDASKGLDVYVWHWGNGYRCWVTEATKEQKKAWQDYRIIPDEATGFPALTPEDVRAILAFYDIPAKKITVIPYQHPLSSYLWAQDGKIVNGDVTMADLREMFGL